MATDRWIRASDQDRQSAVELLSEGYAVGRLRREELDERATLAYSATTWGELRDLTADLPLPLARAGPLPHSVASRHAPPRASQRLVSLLIWTFFNACAGGWCGRASAPRRHVGGRDPDTHCAAAYAPARHQGAAQHPRGNATRASRPRTRLVAYPGGQWLVSRGAWVSPAEPIWGTPDSCRQIQPNSMARRRYRDGAATARWARKNHTACPISPHQTRRQAQHVRVTTKEESDGKCARIGRLLDTSSFGDRRSRKIRIFT